MHIPIIKNRKIWYSLSGMMLLAAIGALLLWGLNFSIDFTGGSLVEVHFSQERPSVREVQQSLEVLALGEIQAQPAGESGMIIRMREMSEAKHQELLGLLNQDFGSSGSSDEENGVQELRFESIGPAVGQELQQKAFTALLVSLVFIIAYIAYAFRKVSEPVASWKFGVTAIIALVHDVVIITGVFAALGQFMGVEVGSMFVTALLTIIGFSVHDTIVVFDRTRENLLHSNQRSEFESIVETSVNQTIWRSVNTSVSTLLVLSTVFFFGGSAIAYFILSLMLGILVGTYSSIFIASPVVVDWHYLSLRKNHR